MNLNHGGPTSTRCDTTGTAASDKSRAEKSMTKTCFVEACEQPHHARGWCNSHYYRWQKYGDPRGGSLFNQRPNLECVIDACKKPQTCRGWCATHYTMWIRRGDPQAPPLRSARGPHCLVDACNRPVQARGMCTKHYQRWQRHGDPLVGSHERAPNGSGSISRAGYRLVTFEGNLVLEHRKVMAEHLGRPLLPEEVVHHRGARTDNRVEVLQLFPNNAAHMSFHAELRRAA
jgi:hypothetical protein